MKKMRTAILPLILPLALAALACTIFVGGPDYPKTPVPVSTEAVGSLDDQFHAAETAAADSGTLTLTINESQITSLLADKLAEQTDPSTGSSQAPFITDPQVYLRDGQIQIYGKAAQGNLQANVRIILSATLDDNGKPVISVVSADFGPLPVAESLNNAISKMVDEAFTGAIGPAAIGFRLESLTIADGVMTLTGRVK
ncbi:MAG: hypothetical protein WA821_13040 [Anaerolineales bacterium]